MAKTTKARSEGRNQGTPVSKEIKRAAARMAYAPSVEASEPTVELREVELSMLRRVAAFAVATFEANGCQRPKSTQLLAEALRSARSDFEQLQGYEGNEMAFVRAQYRCDLALQLVDYIETFGPVSTVGRNIDEEGGAE